MENVNDFNLQYVGMTICWDNNSLSVTFSLSMQKLDFDIIFMFTFCIYILSLTVHSLSIQ